MAAPAQSADPALAAAVTQVITEQQKKLNLRAVLYTVRVNEQEVVTGAVGESMTGVLATPDMYFRNGAVAEAYMSTLLLRLVDQGVVHLDDRLSTWLPGGYGRRGSVGVILTFAVSVCSPAHETAV